MNPQRILTLSSALVLCSCFALAQTSAPATPASTAPAQDSAAKKPVVLPDQKLTDHGKMEIIRGMTAELGFARKPFPFGKNGITMKDGKIVSPSEEQLNEMMTMYGPAVKVGDRALITQVRFKDKAIIFDINGGPVKKQKWYQHIQVGVGGGVMQPGQPTDQTNIHGSLVELQFDKFVPEVTPAQLKQLLDPVLNFSAKTATEGYLDTVPPKAKAAIKDHKALVGMNREMVEYALGRPPQKYRDKDPNGNDYEEWIYGTPPQEVQFVRFEGDEVVRIEIMKVDGTKQVRTEREITIPNPQQTEVAQQQGQPAPNQPQGQAQQQPGGGSDQAPAERPSLRRPGEEDTPQPNPQDMPKNQRGPIPAGGGDPTQNAPPANGPPI